MQLHCALQHLPGSKTMAFQYEFQVINRRNGARDQVRATAMTELDARDAIVAYYGDTHAIGEAPQAVRIAHAVLGEINCL